MEFDRVPDILDIHFNAEDTFPEAFPDIHLRDEDFNALHELDIEHSFFHQVDQMKPDPDQYSQIAPEHDLLSAGELDDLTSADCMRGEKRPFCADVDLTDLDNSDKLRRDCMWSSGPNANKFYRPDQSAALPVASPLLLNDDLGLCTPPTSYIHQYIEQFQEVLTNASDDVCSVSSGDDSDWSSIANESDVDQSMEVPSTPPATTTYESFSTTLLLASQESRNLSSGDHSYYTNMNESSILTPPESSDDDDDSMTDDSIKEEETLKAISTITNTASNSLRVVSRSSNQTKLNTESLRQEIQRIAEQRRAHPKFTIKIQMKAKSRQLKAMKHLKGLRRFANATSSSTSTMLLLNPEENVEKPKDARDMHNHMERQRRNELRNAFDYLKNYVPCVAKSDRASKQMILDKAIEFCQTVKYKEENLNKERQALHEKKIALQKRIMQLQRQNSLH